MNRALVWLVRGHFNEVSRSTPVVVSIRRRYIALLRHHHAYHHTLLRHRLHHAVHGIHAIHPTHRYLKNLLYVAIHGIGWHLLHHLHTAVEGV